MKFRSPITPHTTAALKHYEEHAVPHVPESEGEGEVVQARENQENSENFGMSWRLIFSLSFLAALFIILISSIALYLICSMRSVPLDLC